MTTFRIGAIAFLMGVLACSTISVVMLERLGDFHDQRAGATSRVSGTIVEDDIGEDMDIRVRWTDAEGRTHTTRFGIYDTDRYVKGKTFEVRFDPAGPSSRVYPADPEETLEEDDLYAGMLLPWSLVLIVGIWWIVRAVRTAVSRREAARPARMRVVSAYNVNGGPVAGILRTTWIALERDTSKEFQRVSWHPSLSTVMSVEPVQVSRGGGSSTVELGDGTRLSPIGRTRQEPPGRLRLEPIAAVRTSRADSFIGYPVAPHDAWLRSMVTRALYGAVIGCLPGAAFGSTTLMWIGALLGAAGTVNIWALHGADR